jgi:hypothetical protein
MMMTTMTANPRERAKVALARRQKAQRARVALQERVAVPVNAMATMTVIAIVT